MVKTMIVLRVPRPLQPELPPVEASYQDDGEDAGWVCEDEYVRTWLEDEAEWLSSKHVYLPYPEASAARSAVRQLRAEIVSMNLYDEEDRDELVIY